MLVLCGFETGFDQHFFKEWIADLDGGAKLAVVLERAGCQPGRAVDAVSTRVGSHQHQDIAHASSGRSPQIFVTQNSDAHCVDQWIARVGITELNFPADIWHSDAIAVSRNSGDDSLE